MPKTSVWVLAMGIGRPCTGPTGLPGFLPKTPFSCVPIYLAHIPLTFERSKQRFVHQHSITSQKQRRDERNRRRVMTESKKNVASKHTKRNVEWRSEGTTSKYAEVNLFLSLADFESWRLCRAFDNC